jgi:MerR family transcriptional regulator, heat shock protein HspR
MVLMVERKYFLVQISSASVFSPHLTRAEVAYRCGLHPELIERLVSLGLIDYVERDINGDALFHTDVIPLIRRIMRLRNQLGVNYAGIGVILDLMARIESLESHIRELENRMFGCS